MENTTIGWTGHTLNPWRGCSEVLLPEGTPHPGCEHCYAKIMSKINPKMLGTWGPDGLRVRAVQKTFELPLKWDKAAQEAGRIDNIFVDSMSDFFEDREDVAPWRMEAFDIMDQCQNLNFQILTKRPENVPPMSGGKRRLNTMFIYSASNQKTWDYGAPLILQCSDLCSTVGISLEPMLGPVDTRQHIARIGWVIIGCESAGPRVGRLGDDFRDETEWWAAAADVVRQCADAGVPCFMKQGPRDGRVVHDPEDFPESCRVREFPAAAVDSMDVSDVELSDALS